MIVLELRATLCEVREEIARIIKAPGPYEVRITTINGVITPRLEWRGKP